MSFPGHTTHLFVERFNIGTKTTCDVTFALKQCDMITNWPDMIDKMFQVA